MSVCHDCDLTLGVKKPKKTNPQLSPRLTAGNKGGRQPVLLNQMQRRGLAQSLKQMQLHKEQKPAKQRARHLITDKELEQEETRALIPETIEVIPKEVPEVAGKGYFCIPQKRQFVGTIKISQELSRKKGTGPVITGSPRICPIIREITGDPDPIKAHEGELLFERRIDGHQVKIFERETPQEERKVVVESDDDAVLLPCGLTQAQVIDLLFREIDPNDYELLKMLDETIPPKTVDKAELDKMPVVKFDDVPKDKLECGVCLLDFEKEDVIKKTSCNHYFHGDCIEKYLGEYGDKCPVCQAEI